MKVNEDPFKGIESIISGIEDSMGSDLRDAFAHARDNVQLERTRQASLGRAQSEAIVNAALIIDELDVAMAAMRRELARAEKQRDESRAKSEMLAKAQADAIVHSATIIAELEETKRNLELSHAAEERAKVAAQRLSSFGDILEKSDNEIYVINSRTLKFEHVNQGACKNIGYTMDELREMTPLDLKPDFTPKQFADQIQPLRDGSANFVRFNTDHLRKDGTRYPITVHLHCSQFEGRDVLVSLILDITQQERAAEAIRKLSVAVEQSPASVIITDVHGGIEYVNPMFTQVTGYSKHDALSADTRMLLGGRLSEEEYHQLWQTVRGGEVWRGEFQSRKKTGELYWSSVSVSPIRNSRNETTHYLAVIQDVTNNKRLLDQMETLAFHDSLTGLPNRTSILKTIQQSIDADDDRKFALLFLDFDRFKLINDSLGHDMGDELLRQISDRLRGNLRSTDIVSARLGGDEFVVMLNELDDWDAATAVAERLLSVFSASYHLDGNTVYSTASIGVVTNEREYDCANKMLRDADLAMYEAKSMGKGCCVVFNQSMHERAQVRLQVECDLRKALVRDEFFLQYQPIVSLETGKLAGVESLIRWEHPERGLVRPDEFIPVAEETRLIIPMGHWIMDEACRQFSEWQETMGNLAPPSIHVNVSRLQMLLPNLVDSVKDCLTRHNMPAKCLHLEITESIIMHDPKTIVRAMESLRELGVKIDMDDFGTGYSSLSCLHEFPIDVLKIDRSFVNNERHIRDFVALLHTIMALADNLGLQVVAEGIETVEQVATLQSLGCEFGQGYLFAKPLSVDGLQEFARRNVEPTSEFADVAQGI